MILNNPPDYIQAQPRTVSHRFCCKKRLEDAVLNGSWDSRTVVDYFHNDPIVLAAGLNPELTRSFHRIRGVRYQVRPDLVQFTAMCADLRQRSIVFADDLNAVPELVPQHSQCAFNSCMDVDVLLR